MIRYPITLIFILCIPAVMEAPGVTVARPEPVLRWQAMGLPEPALMARLIIAESNGNPQAVSSRGAIGLCQIMPALARGLGADPGRLMDAEYNLTIGARWLGILIARYGVDGALRAYTCGETARHLWYTPAVDAYVQKILKEEF